MSRDDTTPERLAGLAGIFRDRLGAAYLSQRVVGEVTAQCSRCGEVMTVDVLGTHLRWALSHRRLTGDARTGWRHEAERCAVGAPVRVFGLVAVIRNERERAGWQRRVRQPQSRPPPRIDALRMTDQAECSSGSDSSSCGAAANSPSRGAQLAVCSSCRFCRRSSRTRRPAASRTESQR